MTEGKNDVNTSADARQQAEALVPTDWGSFYFTAHADDKGDYTPHLVLRHPECNPDNPVIVRIHSECITGEVFHSQKCDCGQQLNESMKLIAQEKGILVYLRQEGRGIGIINKLKAYKHQEDGLDTIEANIALGLKPDYRKYDVAVEILRSLGIKQVRLITNNPDKIASLNQLGLNVTERIPLIIPPNENSADYLKTKEDHMGHLLS